MKQILTSLLLSLFVCQSVIAQDSVTLYPKYFRTIDPGKIDARMLYNPFEASQNDSTTSYMEALLLDANLLTPIMLYECPGADSAAVYLRVEDTLTAGILTGKSQNVMELQDVQGPMNWRRVSIALPRGTLIVGLTLPVYSGLNPQDLNEQGARCWFGRMTAYYPAKADVHPIYYHDTTTVEYYDVLGRPSQRSARMRRINDHTFLTQ